MATPSTEQRELQLLDSVEFKILGVANKEDKLHQLLQTYLAPVILKAASEHASVRTKVIQILARLKTFIQPPRIVLPISALLQQYKSNHSALIQQLDLSFLQHSLERIDDDERRDLIPIALKGCALDEGQPRGGPFFAIILRLLLDARIPLRGSKEDEGFRNALGLSDEADAKYLAKMIGIFVRLRAPSTNQTINQANPALSHDELSTLSMDSTESQKILQRISELKSKLVTLLASAAFTDEEKFLPALFAASSFDNRVASTAEEIIKRTSVSMEELALVHRLFKAHSMLPAAYRTRILGILSKSTISTTMTESVMNVVALDFAPPQSDQSSIQALQPSSVLERTKLHRALFQYISWVARVGPSKEGFDLAPQLIKNMRQYIEDQGWPTPNQTSNDDVALRSKAYETIGMLVRAEDMSADDRLDLAIWLFRSLSEDPTSDSIVNIDGAISSLTASVPPSMGSQWSGLISMLLTYMTASEDASGLRSTRHAVVKWMDQCLPFADIRARWADILAVSGRLNERSDVIEQGHKGLDPWTYFAHSDSNAAMPDWKEMTVAFFASQFGPDGINGPTSTEQLAHVSNDNIFQNFAGTRLKAFPVALRYCKQIMMLSALKDFDIQPDWMQNLRSQIKTNIETRSQIREYLRTVDKGLLSFYLRACLSGAFREDSPITEDCLRSFVEVASLSPREALNDIASGGISLLPLVKANEREIRTLAAASMGILISHPSNSSDVVGNWCMTLEALYTNGDNMSGPDLNAAEGALLAQSHILSRCVYYHRDPPNGFLPPFHFLTSDQVPASLLDSSLQAFSQLWSAQLALPFFEGHQSITTISEKLSAHAKKGNEKAITALGRLALGLGEENVGDSSADDEEKLCPGAVGTILKALFALHEIKRVEVQFTVGDAISAAVSLWDSDHVKLTMDVDPIGDQFQKPARQTLVAATLSKLFKDCKATKPSLLKASGIWLFCLVQYCSHLTEVQSRLREAQAAFMRLLSARDELVQETASRGLSLVYERGDAELKSALVKDLVSAFTGSGTQLKVEEETELFEPGALPTGEGNSVTSYKDIVNLANEVGDQRLVYKFMSLAANAATWSTRSAFGRFGLSNILSESEVDPKLYPKLFRYRFDPNSNVQRSMDDIWKALIKDSNAAIDEHFVAIMDDLLISILGREWRMREASCAAIADLVHGRPFAQYEKFYRDIWTKALKVLDDVKGSVRQAALRLCMALSNSLVRQLEEGGHGSAAKAMMKEALPFLLSDKGMESSVKDVQLFATVTVMKITKKGGDSLKPFIPEMIPQLLGLLSTIEPEQINYHYQRAGEDSRDQIDKLRSQMVNQSPISVAIEDCLRFVDKVVMSELAPRLEVAIKSAIGMPTKIGCSRVLTTLATRHANDVRPVSGRLMQLLEKQVMDKNDEVSQAYARAAAYVMRVVPDDVKQRSCERFVNMYLSSEDESRRQKISDVIVALAKVSPDHFTSQETELLPFSYLGSHDSDEYTSKVFKEVWSQHAGSNRTVKRYVSEIVDLVERCLTTTQWALRHTGAFTVAAMVQDVADASDATNSISEASLKAIWPVLDKALALKTFPGKEKLLESFPEFVEKGQSLWRNDADIAAQMKKIAIREAKRNNDEYRPHAFRCLWRFAKARDDLDLIPDIDNIVMPYLDELKDEEKMDVDTKDVRQDLPSKTAKNGLEAIARGYSRSSSQNPWEVRQGVIKRLQPYLSSQKYGAIKREIWYECVIDLMTDTVSAKIPQEFQSFTREDAIVVLAYIRSLDLDRAETGMETQRIQRVKAVSKALKNRVLLMKELCGPEVSELRSRIEVILKDERAMEVQRAWKEVLQELGSS